MQLPKTRRRQKLREKKCQYPGCGKIFFGIHIAKYCHEHRKDQYRIRKRAAPEDVNLKNQTIKHNNTEVQTVIMECGLEGCEHEFELKIFPRQYVYPKYCDMHRNEFKRVLHLRRIGREDLIEEMLSAGDQETIEDILGGFDEPDDFDGDDHPGIEVELSAQGERKNKKKVEVQDDDADVEIDPDAFPDIAGLEDLDFDPDNLDDLDHDDF